MSFLRRGRPNIDRHISRRRRGYSLPPDSRQYRTTGRILRQPVRHRDRVTNTGLLIRLQLFSGRFFFDRLLHFQAIPIPFLTLRYFHGLSMSISGIPRRRLIGLPPQSVESHANSQPLPADSISAQQRLDNSWVNGTILPPSRHFGISHHYWSTIVRYLHCIRYRFRPSKPPRYRIFTYVTGPLSARGRVTDTADFRGTDLPTPYQRQFAADTSLSPEYRRFPPQIAMLALRQISATAFSRQY